MAWRRNRPSAASVSPTSLFLYRFSNASMPASATRSLFQPGHNCWRVENARRAAFLIDGDNYFTAFVEAARQAKRSILISGWDFHSRTRLMCRDPQHCELELGDFLNDLASRNRHRSEEHTSEL